MKHYINTDNQIFAFDDTQLHLVTADMREISNQELAELLAPTPEQLAEQAKMEARAYLSSTDWVEPYLIKHYTGMVLLPPESNKFIIEQKRKEAMRIVK
jgi:hypothetical protein